MLAHPGEVIVASKTTVEALAPGVWATYTHAAELTLGEDAQLVRLGAA